MDQKATSQLGVQTDRTAELHDDDAAGVSDVEATTSLPQLNQPQDISVESN
ncbi:uncharacterized protein V6R79_018155 [Siganus canaliculatus]